MRKIIVYLLLTAMVLALAACKMKEEDDNMEVEERLRKASYFVAMYFQSNVPWLRATSRKLADQFTDVVLVYNEEDAAEFPDSVIVAWPYEKTYKMLDAFNYEIFSRAIDLEQYSLQYPLTIENLIEDWEKVDDLWWNEVRRLHEWL